VTADELQNETTEVLQSLVRFNTVNPPGGERPAIDYLEDYLAQAGLRTELLAADDDRPNLVADLDGDGDGPTLCFLSHVDTVLAEPAEWTHDPWAGDVADGFVWGRGSIDMKSQAAAEAVAAATLARQGWRPSRGALKVVFTVDEETGGEVGASWITRTHPDRVRCDMLLNEGGGGSFDYQGKRHYGVCCAEKGIFRFSITAIGAAGHASLPRTGDNALLKLGPVLQKLARQPESFEVTEAPAALLRDLGEDPADPGAALARIAAYEPRLRTLVEPMFGVTLTPTMAAASEQMNVIPSRARIMVDCRVPPGLGEEEVRRGVAEVLGEAGDGWRIEFSERVAGNGSPAESQLMESISAWVAEHDPGAEVVPVILPGFTDSRHFRLAFPECVAYGFFPHRHQPLVQSAPLIHGADERIDVRDLALATELYGDLARRLLG
jgi:acetylornithine deacetylase/succinyl-diaminopimelate desuccinylase-like protein